MGEAVPVCGGRVTHTLQGRKYSLAKLAEQYSAVYTLLGGGLHAPLRCSSEIILSGSFCL